MDTTQVRLGAPVCFCKLIVYSPTSPHDLISYTNLAAAFLVVLVHLWKHSCIYKGEQFCILSSFPINVPL